MIYCLKQLTFRDAVNIHCLLDCPPTKKRKSIQTLQLSDELPYCKSFQPLLKQHTFAPMLANSSGHMSPDSLKFLQGFGLEVTLQAKHSKVLVWMI